MGTRYDNKDLAFQVADRPRRKAGNQGGVRKAGFTEVQLETLQFWRSFEDEHGFPPSIRDAAQHFGGLQTYAVVCRCKWIVAKGAMQMVGSGFQSRRVLLTKLGRSMTIGRDPDLYIQTDHGFVGTVTQERKCECGRSHFTDNTLCAECIHDSKVVK